MIACACSPSCILARRFGQKAGGYCHLVCVLPKTLPCVGVSAYKTQGGKHAYASVLRRFVISRFSATIWEQGAGVDGLKFLGPPSPDFSVATPEQSSVRPRKTTLTQSWFENLLLKAEV